MAAITELSSTSFAERALRALPFAVIATDLDGRVVAAGEAAQSMLGLELCEGMLYQDLPLAARRKRPQMAAPLLLHDSAGKDVWPVRGEDGGIIGAVQLLEDADEPLDGEKLCAAMAHELKNPLAGIHGFARLLEHDLQNDDRSELVAKIISGVHALDATVSNMLNFCRSKLLHTEPVELRPLIGSAVELAGCTQGIDVDIDTGRCRTIRCDRLNMTQVLINLIKNAAEAMPDGGKLTFTADRADESARIVVADTGRGMDAHTRANIFRPFFSTRDGGTGMGLAVVSKIMHQHGGDIEIESRPEKGTKIILTLPAS